MGVWWLMVSGVVVVVCWFVDLVIVVWCDSGKGVVVWCRCNDVMVW